MIPKEYIDLYPYTYMKTGGPARYFFIVTSESELKEVVVFAQKNCLPWVVLGDGSNVLVSDQGFNGVVIKNEIQGISYIDTESGVEVVAGAGENWDALVADTVEKKLFGLENLSLIPGSVGAAPVQNINAYGAQAGDVIKCVSVFDTDRMEERTLSNAECAFTYRSSIFKSNKHLVVTGVTFLLKRTGDVHIEYKDLGKYFSRKSIQNPTTQQVRDAVVLIRTGKLPNPEKVGTAGSFFMHPIIPEQHAQHLQEQFPRMLFAPYTSGSSKVISGRLLELLGWKGITDGNVGTHKTHALTVVNHGEKNAAEVYAFAKRMQEDVKKKTGVDLEFEVTLVGWFVYYLKVCKWQVG